MIDMGKLDIKEFTDNISECKLNMTPEIRLLELKISKSSRIPRTNPLLDNFRSLLS